METIGTRLRLERERLRISQAAVIERLGIAKSTQINYESDKRSPDAAYLAAVAQLGFDVGYIVTGAISAPVHGEDAAFLARFRVAPPVIRNGVEALLASVPMPATTQPSTDAPRVGNNVNINGGTQSQVVAGDVRQESQSFTIGNRPKKLKR